MQLMKIEELIPHPRNSDFFDDMSGDKWKEFLESIKTSGVIEPIVITQDKVIVSGHQRVRACKELGIAEILAEVKVYDDEDAILKDLLETNIRQRGTIGGSSVKLGRRIRELERIYGIHNGGNDKVTRANNVQSGFTQEDLANQLGISVRTLQNAKSLPTLPVEIQEMVEQGNIPPSTASRLIAKLTPEQQEHLIQSLPATERLTQKQVQEYVDRLRDSENSIDTLNKKIAELENSLAVVTTNATQTRNDTSRQIELFKSQIAKLTQERDRLAAQKTQTVTQRIEVDKPETLQKVEELQRQLREKTETNKRLVDENTERGQLLSQVMGTSTNFKLVSHCSEITLKMLNFIKDMAQYDYMAECFNEIPDATRNEYARCVKSVGKWAENILGTIEGQRNIITVNSNE